MSYTHQTAWEKEKRKNDMIDRKEALLAIHMAVQSVLVTTALVKFIFFM